MSPFTLLAWLLIVALATPVIAYVIGKRALNRKARANEQRYRDFDAGQEWVRESGLAVGDSPESPKLRAAREKMRPEAEAVDIYKKLAAEVFEPAVRARATADARNNGWKMPDYTETFNPKPFTRYAPPVFGKRKPSIFLTARQLERVNISRRATGRLFLNIAGFSNAVACAWGGHKPELVPQPEDTTQWLIFLLLYECLLPGHHSSDWADLGTGLTITPDMPYNGQEPEHLGAGVSGAWQDPDASTATAAAAIAAGMAILTQDDGWRYDPTTEAAWHDPAGALGPVGQACPGAVGTTGPEPVRTVGGMPYEHDPLSDPNSFKGSSDNDSAQNVQDPGDRPVEPATAGDGYHFKRSSADDIVEYGCGFTTPSPKT